MKFWTPCLIGWLVLDPKISQSSLQEPMQSCLWRSGEGTPGARRQHKEQAPLLSCRALWQSPWCLARPQCCHQVPTKTLPWIQPWPHTQHASCSCCGCSTQTRQWLWHLLVICEDRHLSAAWVAKQEGHWSPLQGFGEEGAEADTEQTCHH